VFAHRRPRIYNMAAVYASSSEPKLRRLIAVQSDNV
jgi:hypothetical protein